MKSLLLVLVALVKCAFSIQCAGNTCQCPGGGEFDRNTWCDGKTDCADNFDEVDAICKFHCNDPKNTVIPRMESGYPASFCDGVKDCPNGVDEENCGFTPTWKCGTGNLITQEQICDGQKNCEDGLDEIMCTQGCYTVEQCQALAPNYTVVVQWNSCVVYVNEESNWDNANEWCEQLPHGSLLYYPEERVDAYTAIKDQFGLSVNYFYIGLRQIENSADPDGWQWHRAHGIEDATDTIPWRTGEPDGASKNALEDCGAITQSEVVDYSCTDPYYPAHFFCEYRP